MSRPSLPTRECGLKSDMVSNPSDYVMVTPYAGVWIEIGKKTVLTARTTVTPYAGVWIEIEKFQNV